MTESAKIAAYNALTEQKGAADAAYNRGVADLNNYVREQEKSEQDALYNEIMTTIDSGSWNASDELYNYLGVTKGTDNKFSVASEGNPLIGGLSNTQRAQVMQRLQMYANNPEQQAADEAYKDQNALREKVKDSTIWDDIDTGLVVHGNEVTDTWYDGDHFTLTFGDDTKEVKWKNAQNNYGDVGQRYNVMSAGVLDSAASIALVQQNVNPNIRTDADMKEFFEGKKDRLLKIGGSYYVYNGDGLLIKVKKHGNYDGDNPSGYNRMLGDIEKYKAQKKKDAAAQQSDQGG